MELVRPDSPWAPYVSIDPERLGGEPVFRDSRVPVRVLFEYIEGGYTLEQFLDDFEGVTREQTAAVLRLSAANLEREIKAA